MDSRVIMSNPNSNNDLRPVEREPTLWQELGLGEPASLPPSVPK